MKCIPRHRGFSKRFQPRVRRGAGRRTALAFVLLALAATQNGCVVLRTTGQVVGSVVKATGKVISGAVGAVTR